MYLVLRSFLSTAVLTYNDDFELLLNGTNLAKLSDGKTVTINNLVPNPNNRSTDHADYINNPSSQVLLLTSLGWTVILKF
jgi:hypothetical protein